MDWPGKAWSTVVTAGTTGRSTDTALYFRTCQILASPETRADRALYSAKSKGRNRVEVVESGGAAAGSEPRVDAGHTLAADGGEGVRIG